MRVLVFGAHGWLGPQIIAHLVAKNHTALIAKSRLGGANPVQDEEIDREIVATAPTHVLLAVGRTHMPGQGTTATTIDCLEGSPDRLRLNVRDNLEAPVQVARVCAKRGVHVTYIGTGCIYHYDDAHPQGATDASKMFSESDPPNFFGSSYSIVKGTTDGLLRQLPGVLNARIRMPVGDTDHPRNFITKITTYKKVVNIPNSMTVLHNLLPVLVDLMNRGITGPINFVNPGAVSHNQILELYRDIVDPSFTWENFTVEEQTEVLLSGRSNCELDATRLTTLSPEVKPALQAIRECMVNIAKTRKA